VKAPPAVDAVVVDVLHGVMIAKSALQPCGAVAIELLLLSPLPLLLLLSTVSNRLSHLSSLLGFTSSETFSCINDESLSLQPGGQPRADQHCCSWPVETTDHTDMSQHGDKQAM
jgi:hypothetical protein